MDTTFCDQGYFDWLVLAAWSKKDAQPKIFLPVLGLMVSSKASNSRPFVVGLGIRDHNVVQSRDQGNFDEAMKM